MDEKKKEQDWNIPPDIKTSWHTALPQAPFLFLPEEEEETKHENNVGCQFKGAVEVKENIGYGYWTAGDWRNVMSNISRWPY